MSQVYRAIGTSKQNLHQRLNTFFKQQEEKAQLDKVILQVREDHPEMGALSLFQLIKPKHIGRDRFVRWYHEMGYTLYQKKNFRRTTDSDGVTRFDNLLEELELTGVNQAYSSDITYYTIDEKVYYLTFVLDLFSRKIKGYSASTTLMTIDTTIPALKMALKDQGKHLTPGLIFHSDGGGQYYSKEFLKITKEANILNSMGRSVFENPHAERLNGIIKNKYIRHYNPRNFKSLKQQLKRSVAMYNLQKPHEALGGMSPEVFESILIKKSTKKVTKQINNQLLKTVNYNQY